MSPHCKQKGSYPPPHPLISSHHPQSTAGPLAFLPGHICQPCLASSFPPGHTSLPTSWPLLCPPQSPGRLCQHPGPLSLLLSCELAVWGRACWVPRAASPRDVTPAQLHVHLQDLGPKSGLGELTNPHIPGVTPFLQSTFIHITQMLHTDLAWMLSKINLLQKHLHGTVT